MADAIVSVFGGELPRNKKMKIENCNGIDMSKKYMGARED